jgi:hypothetical protein
MSEVHRATGLHYATFRYLRRSESSSEMFFIHTARPPSDQLLWHGVPVSKRRTMQ